MGMVPTGIPCAKQGDEEEDPEAVSGTRTEVGEDVGRDLFYDCKPEVSEEDRSWYVRTPFLVIAKIFD